MSYAKITASTITSSLVNVINTPMGETSIDTLDIQYSGDNDIILQLDGALNDSNVVNQILIAAGSLPKIINAKAWNVSVKYLTAAPTTGTLYLNAFASGKK
jgi:hypothetical protein